MSIIVRGRSVKWTSYCGLIVKTLRQSTLDLCFQFIIYNVLREFMFDGCGVGWIKKKIINGCAAQKQGWSSRMRVREHWTVFVPNFNDCSLRHDTKLLFSCLEPIKGQRLESTKYVIIFIFVSTTLENVQVFFVYTRFGEFRRQLSTRLSTIVHGCFFLFTATSLFRDALDS